MWAFGQTLGSRTAQLLWHDIHPVFSLSHKRKKNLLGAPWQAPEATKEMKIMWRTSAQRYRQISLFLQFRHGLLCNIPLLYFVCSHGPFYFYITSFPVLINKARIFCYSYNMYSYTTSHALDSHIYSSDLVNTWCATSCQNFQE